MRPKRKDKHTKRLPQRSEETKGEKLPNETSKETNCQTPSASSTSLSATINTEHNSSEDEESQVHRTPSYKREIRSNWDRYKEEGDKSDAEVEEPKLRGADFAELLATTGEMPHSRFRFKDEKDWDETPENVFNAVLSLDCIDLAKSLKCIPIPTLLDIPQNKFTEEQLKKFADAAKSNSSIYRSQITRELHVPVTTDRVPPKAIQNKIPEFHETTSNAEVTRVDNEPLEPCVVDEDRYEDELDALLAMGVADNFQKPAIVLPDIDKLLLPKITSTTVETPDVQTTASKPETSLEDWLDDFLQE